MLVTAAGIKAPPGQRAPRLHDLRHVFTVSTLLDWYRDGGDVQARLPVLSTWLGHIDPKSTYWYLSAVPELLALAAARLEPAGQGRAGGIVTDLAPVLQGFFTDRLARQKKASPNTVAAYRDTCRLLLAFARDQTGKPPSQLSLADLDAALVGAFLSHLEDQRGNGSATRNARLAAIHSLFKYAAPKAPEHAAVISQVLAIPPRRRERAIVSYLTAEEIDALVAAPGRETWHGRRDHALLLLDVQTGLRVSELTGLKPPGHPPRGRAARPLPRQGPQGPGHPAHRPDRQGHADLARRAQPRPRRPAVPHPARRPALPRRRRAARRQARRHRRRGTARRSGTSTSPRTRCGTPQP